MKAYLILIFLWSAAGAAMAQQVKLLKGDMVVNPSELGNASKSIHTAKLSFLLSGTPPAAKTTDIQLDFTTYGTSKVNLTAVNKVVTFTQQDWQGPLPKEVTKEFDVQLKPSNNLAADETAYITIKSAPAGITVDPGADCFFAVRVSRTGVYDSNKPFWVEVGANFDLVDGLEPNNFFTGVFFYKRDIRPVLHRSAAAIKKRQDAAKAKGKEVKPRFQSLTPKNTLAIFAGVFENKTVTNLMEDQFALRRYYDSTSIVAGNDTTMKVYTGIGNFTRSTTVRNVALFFSPQVKLTNKSANENGFYVFGSFWTELQWQRVREERNFRQINLLGDTIIPIEDALANPEFNTKTNTIERDIRSHYTGLGLPVFFREGVSNDVVQLFLNPVFGITNQPNTKYQKELLNAEAQRVKNPDFPLPNRPWSPFYVVQSRLNEEKYGIAFTGEVRGLLLRNNPPFVSLSLTKKFDLTKFIEYNN